MGIIVCSFSAKTGLTYLRIHLVLPMVLLVCQATSILAALPVEHLQRLTRSRVLVLFLGVHCWHEFWEGLYNFSPMSEWPGFSQLFTLGSLFFYFLLDSLCQVMDVQGCS